MLGLMLGMVAAGGCAIGTVMKTIDDATKRKRAIDHNQEIYYDHFGAMRLVHNNERVFYRKNSEGDYCYYDAFNNLIINLDKEKRDKNVCELKNSNPDASVVYYHHKFYPNGFKRKVDVYIDKSNNRKVYKDNISFADIENNNAKKEMDHTIISFEKGKPIYFKYYIYVDCESGFSVRFADENKDLLSKDIQDIIINELNYRQTKYINKYGHPNYNIGTLYYSTI